MMLNTVDKTGQVESWDKYLRNLSNCYPNYRRMHVEKSVAIPSKPVGVLINLVAYL